VSVIRTAGLSKRYGATTALDDLSLDVVEGEVFGFLGPNGSGKTTTIRLLLGLIHPSAGGATVLELDPWSDAVELHRRVAFVPGEVNVWPQLTGGEVLDLLGHLHGSVDAAFRDELIDRFVFDPTKRCRSYSRGNRQKIALIAGFMCRPDLLILDEPTSGLDPLMEVEFRGCVGEARDRGQTVFLSSHILSEAELLCDRVGILRAGKLIDVGTIEDLRHLSALEVELVVRGPVPDVAALDGATDVRELGAGHIGFGWRGDAGPLLRALAGFDVVRFISHEPDLEQLFLRFYG
jgi:ABC-2 type transport system ATP-binding protein